MKCPRCRKHRIRTKESMSDVFTCGPYKVKYCIGCGWEKTVSPKEPPKELIMLDPPQQPQKAEEGMQGAVGVESLPVGAPEAVVEPITGTEPEKKGFLAKITSIFK